MRRVLVTGATGGIGLTLVPLLLTEGFSVTATGRSAEPGARLAAMGARFLAADLVTDRLEPLIEGADAVIHLAARSSAWGTEPEFHAANVTATRRLLDVAGAGGVRRFVLASTPSIYAERRDRLGLTEASPPAARPMGAYVRSKHAAERLVLARDGAAMRTIAVRPRAVAGPHDAALLPRLARVAAAGPIPMPRGGAALIEITDVRDAARAFVAAARSEAWGVAVNVSGGHPLPFRALAEAVCRAAGLPFRPLRLPEPMLHAAAVASEALGRAIGREPRMTVQGAAAISWSQTFDLSGARRLLGWAPCHAPLEAIAHATEAWGR